MYSSASVCFWFLILFMVKLYVLGGPYLLYLDFMIYIFIGVYRCSIISELPSDLSSGFIVFTFYLRLRYPLYLPVDHPRKNLCLNYNIPRFVPPSLLYYDSDFFFNGALVYTTFIMFFYILYFISFGLNFTCPLDLTSFFLFSFGIFSSAHWSVPLQSYLFFRLSSYLSIGFYPFVLVSFRLKFNFSLDRTAFSFFFSLFMFPLYHLLFNCQHIFKIFFKFFIFFCFSRFNCDFSEYSNHFSVTLCSLAIPETSYYTKTKHNKKGEKT